MNFFNSPQVQENLQDIFHTYQQVASMTSKMTSMCREAKLEHIDECKELIDKQKTFYTRLCLAAMEGDEGAADMKTRINAMSQAFGFNDLADCMDALVDTLNKAAANT